MATEVIMPKVDMVQEEGTFVEWLKEEGKQVKKGEPLFVILTDKASIEIEAPADGILAGVKAQPDDVIPVTEVIAYILGPGEELPGEVEEEPTAPAPTPAQTPVSMPSPTEPAEAGVKKPAPGRGKVRATPVARRLAREKGIDLAQVTGTGPRGSVQKSDILDFAEQQQAAAAQPQPTVTAPALEVPLPEAKRKETIALAGPRKIIADRMAYSAFTAPHIVLSIRIDMSEARRLRERVLESIQEKTGYRLSFTAIVARAVAAVLPRHPDLNASLDGEEIIVWEDVHLGIAMAIEDYLIVPVLREAQGKSLEEIAVELGDLRERARTRRMTPTEMTGSTFTISNLGMFGIESFTAIINPPESAVLAVGRIVDTPVGIEGKVALRPMMNLTLSVDHRVTDGAAGARFLADLRDTLENPYLLL